MPVLPALAINALVMMAAALALRMTDAATPQFIAHLSFALGILPLILGAIAYFVPVLTRSQSPSVRLYAVPVSAWLGAATIVMAFSGMLNLALASHLAFPLASGGALALMIWTIRRARATLGSPHPGLRWYLAALACLLLALIAVPAMTAWPAQHAALRLFHLHLNLLGFVGLTAIGTLQVLLPTAAGAADPDAGKRLTGDLGFAVIGVVLIAGGTAWYPVLALAGAILFAIAPLRMLHAWRQHFADRIMARHGAAPSLALACIGLLGLLGLGIAHNLGTLAGRPATDAFVIAFLLPLVSGAATQLLPVWLRPGPQRDWHRDLRTTLGRYGALRSMLLVIGGFAYGLGWMPGLWIAAAGLFLLVFAFAQALPQMGRP